MNKSLIALATAVVAVTTMFASTAEAGFKIGIGFGFPIGGFSAHNGGGNDYGYRRYKRREIVRRRSKEKVHVAKKPVSSAKSLAKAEAAPEAVPTTQAAQTENSSISTAAIETTEEKVMDKTTEAPEKTAEAVVEPKPADDQKTAGKLDCRQFFPSVGLTLSVPCE